MRSLLEAMRDLKEDKILTEMANYYQDETSLPVIVWIDDIGVERRNRHNHPRIKIQNNYSTKVQQGETISILIDDKQPKILAGKAKIKQQDLNEVFEWVKKNYNVLIKYWRHEIRRSELEKHILIK